MKKITIALSLLLITSLNLFSQDSISIYLGNFQYQKALNYIETLESSKELQLKQALCHKALGNYKKSIEILLPLSGEYPTDIQIKSELALCYEAIAKRQISIDYYDDLIRLDSTNVYFKQQKADLLYQQGKFNDALTLFQQIYNQNKSPNALKRIGQCFEKMNVLDSAKIYFKEAWDINPDDSFSAANLTNVCLKQGSLPEALTYSEEYMKRDTTDQQINLLNALCYYKMDDYEAAAERLKKCFEAGDSSLIVNRSLGISYYSLNDSYDAQPFLENAFRQDTTNNNVLYCLAIACNDMGEHEKAIPYFRKLLERTIPPDLTLYLYYKNLASACVKGSHYQDAIDAYVEALKYADDNQKMNIHYTMGNIYQFRLDNDKNALESFKLYKISLTNYLENIKFKEGIEPEEIAATQEKITHLNAYISELRAAIKAGKKSANKSPMVIRTP